AASASSPAATRLSLFASASVTPCSSAHIVGARPANPTTALRTRSGSARCSNSVRSPPLCVSGARPSIGCEPEAAATSSSSGCASITSIACRPIEPVAPRRAIRFTPSTVALAEGQDAEVRRRDGEEQGVDAVEHAAVPAEEAARVLDLHVTLQERLEQIAERADHGEHGAQRDRLADAEEVLLVERDERDEDGRGRPEQEALPRLPRRRRRRELVPAEQAAAQVRERVAGPDREHDGERREPAMCRQVRS